MNGATAVKFVRPAYYPYGQEIGTVTANDRVKFGTYTRDSGSILDYAMNRYYQSTWGRFTSPDPYRASGGPGDPGSWNRYSYVQGDPVNRMDPSGLLYCAAEFGSCLGQYDMDAGFLSTGGGWTSIGGPTFGGWLSAPWAWFVPVFLTGPAPEQRSICTVELWYRPLTMKGTGQNHAYLRVSSTVAGSTAWAQIEGGPSNWIQLPYRAKIPIRFLERKDYSSEASDHTRSDNKMWGRPITSADDPQLCEKISNLFKGVAYVQAHPVQYSPHRGPNSNSYINYLLNQSKISWWLVAPEDTWGWSAKLYP